MFWLTVLLKQLAMTEKSFFEINYGCSYQNKREWMLDRKLTNNHYNLENFSNWGSWQTTGIQWPKERPNSSFGNKKYILYFFICWDSNIFLDKDNDQLTHWVPVSDPVSELFEAFSSYLCLRVTQLNFQLLFLPLDQAGLTIPLPLTF